MDDVPSIGTLRLSADEARDALLFPVSKESVAILPSESCASYLRKCKNNLHAEIWAFYQSKINPSFKTWRDALMTRVYFDDGSFPTITALYTDTRHDSVFELQDAGWSLAVLNNRLFLLIPKRDKETGDLTLKMVQGAEISDSHATGSSSYMHLMGYVKPYFTDLSAIVQLQKGVAEKNLPNDQLLMLKQVAAPELRVPFAFATDRRFSDAVPSNEMQRTVIRSLSNGIECIQGPPGTGKSTTIFHILQSLLPSDKKAIVTCVQNKAIDSIAEKLGTTDLPFIVLGNQDRLGDCAKQHTVEEQVVRDPSVMDATKELHRTLDIEASLRKRLKQIIDSHRRLPVLWRRWWEIYARKRNEALVNDIDRYFNYEHALRSNIAKLRTTTEDRLIMAARAYLSTIDGLASVKDLCSNPVVIIDEAGTVPEYKIPYLLCMDARAIVAIGDQNQLQPFTNSSTVQDGYFQRVVHAIKAPMLMTQYRMHPAICNVVSSQFYGGKLQTAPHVAALRTAVKGSGIVWLDYSDCNAESSDRGKKCNPVEVAMVAKFMQSELASLLAGGKTVAVITFYKHHFSQLMDAGTRAGYVRSEEVSNAFVEFRSRHPNGFQQSGNAIPQEKRRKGHIQPLQASQLPHRHRRRRTGQRGRCRRAFVRPLQPQGPARIHHQPQPPLRRAQPRQRAPRDHRQPTDTNAQPALARRVAGCSSVVTFFNVH